MATSGSVDYTLNRDQLIASAYELIGIGVEGESLQTSEIDVAARALNLMIKAWQGYGLHLWKRAEVTVPLTASQATYTIGRSGGEDVTEDRPLKLLEAHYVDTDSNRTSLVGMSYNEYTDLSNLTTEGKPTQYFFNPTLNDSSISFWPVPDTASAADSVSLVVVQPTEDMDATANDFDFPSEWLEAITYGLAVRLAPRYSGISIQDRMLLKREADDALELAKNFDVEEGSLFLQPDMNVIGH